jgi:hypothetical protein
MAGYGGGISSGQGGEVDGEGIALMPVLLAENIVQLEFSDLWKRRPIDRPDRPLARAAGHHQSQVLAHVARKVGWLKPNEKDESEYPLIWGLGQAIEEYIFSFYKSLIWQPGELVRDGIAMNCDGLGFEHDPYMAYYPSVTFGMARVNQLVECKATFKSVATGEEFVKDPKWAIYQHQGREYCYGYGPRAVRWEIWHMRGDYKTFGPVWKQYVVGFSDKECEQTHRLLLRYKGEVEPEGGQAA